MKFNEVLESFKCLALSHEFKLFPTSPLVSAYPWNEGNFTLSAGLEYIIPILDGSEVISEHRLAFQGRALRNLEIGKIGYSPFHLLVFETGVLVICDSGYDEHNLLQLLQFSFEWIYRKIGLKKEDMIYTVCGEEKAFNVIGKMSRSAFLLPLEKMGVSSNQIIVTKGRRNLVFSKGKLRPTGFSIEFFYPLDDNSYVEICSLHIYFSIFNNGELIPAKNVVMGNAFGLERICFIKNSYATIFDIDVIKPLVQFLKTFYDSEEDFLLIKDRIYIISELLRAITFVLSEKQQANKTHRGQILRNLIKRLYSELAYSQMDIPFVINKGIDVICESYRHLQSSLATEKDSIKDNLIFYLRKIPAVWKPLT